MRELLDRIPVPSMAEDIDRLGMLKDQITALTKEAEDLRARLIERGVGYYEGVAFAAHVYTQDRQVLDIQAVRKYLSPRFITEHTRVTPVTYVRLSVRPEFVQEAVQTMGATA